MADRLEIDYLIVGVVTYPPGATFGPRTMIDHELVWIIDGDVTYHLDGRDIAAPPDTMLLARPGFRDAFTWDPRRPTRHAYFHCGIKAIPDDWPPQDQWPIARRMPDHDVVRPLFRYLISHRATHGQAARTVPTPMLRRAVETLLGALIIGPLGQAAEHGRDYPEPVERAVAFMRQTLEKDSAAPLSLRDLARSAAVSPEHLCRLFRATLNAGPMEALRLLRLDMAMGLLARSNLNVEQIADRCGFASPYHFSRRFRQVYGVPPTAVRKRLAAGEAPPVSPLIRRL